MDSLENATCASSNESTTITKVDLDIGETPGGPHDACDSISKSANIPLDELLRPDIEKRIWEKLSRRSLIHLAYLGLAFILATAIGYFLVSIGIALGELHGGNRLVSDITSFILCWAFAGVLCVTSRPKASPGLWAILLVACMHIVSGLSMKSGFLYWLGLESQRGAERTDILLVSGFSLLTLLSFVRTFFWAYYSI
jgi:hypothetical protein